MFGNLNAPGGSNALGNGKEAGVEEVIGRPRGRLKAEALAMLGCPRPGRDRGGRGQIRN